MIFFRIGRFGIAEPERDSCLLQFVRGNFYSSFLLSLTFLKLGKKRGAKTLVQAPEFKFGNYFFNRLPVNAIAPHFRGQFEINGRVPPYFRERLGKKRLLFSVFKQFYDSFGKSGGKKYFSVLAEFFVHTFY